MVIRLLNSPCVWIETPSSTIPTCIPYTNGCLTTTGTNPLWFNTTTTGTQCVTVPNTIHRVYIDIESQQLFWDDGVTDVTPTQYWDLSRDRVVHYHEVTEYDQNYAEALQENQQRNYKLAQERRQRALEKSKELLLANLTPAQRKTFEKNNWFVVIGGKTKTEYRIHTGAYAGNVVALSSKDKEPVARFCCHCRDDIPLYDHHLSQKLSLEWDEDGFLRTANRTVLRAA